MRIAAKLPPNATPAQILARVNAELTAVWDKMRQMEEQPSLKGPLNMNNQRITNVGQSKRSTDVLSRREAESDGMLKNANGQHVANSEIVATSGIRSNRRARKRYDLVPLAQVQEMVGVGGDAVVTTNTDQLVHGYKSFRGLAMAQLAMACANGLSNQNKDVGSAAGPIGCFIRITGPTAAFSISGFQQHSGAQGGFPGQLIVLFNASAFSMTLLHDSGLSVITNRLYLPNNGNVVVRQRGSMALLYSTLDQRWVAISLL